MSRQEFWDAFCREHRVIEHGVPLFETDDYLRVQTAAHGHDQRLLLKRSQQMESLLIGEAEKVRRDFKERTGKYDGLIYMMFWRRDDRVLPLYIGKAEKFGRSGNLSANIQTSKSFFCRWGDRDAYHIGNLSAATCPGHARDPEANYVKWARTLFVSTPSAAPLLKEQTYFWTTAWSPESIGIWKEFGATNLTFLEYLLIGVGSSIFPDLILNTEGTNRRPQMSS
ncbi:hypothetical protein [Tumebacillus flagellatus]|uniref:Uncharacterized protein n=1 Tax=Tumebacillus flagellatus TaxID=1157490 RepID=A0A074MHV7_9BACL|nr:hypothetical protein [Tumebacillus flagellatus]KEO85272.1 hypothetical protein EL26_01560 [Tumebacillus flagellatus]